MGAPVPAPSLSAPPEPDPLALAEEDLVEQVAGQSSRAVARIIAEANPEVAVPRDTLRPLGEDRFTLKCTIDGECQQGLVQLKGLLSHLDPELSWGTVVARLVQDGIRRYDPRVRGRRSGATAAEPSPGTGGAESLVHPAPRDRSRGELPDEEGSLLPRQEEHGAGESVADCGGAAGSGVAEHPHAGVTSPAKFDSDAPASSSAAPAPVAPTSPAKFDSHAPANGTATPALAEPAPTADLTPLRQPAPSARAIPAAVRRALWQRDQARCAYVDPLTGAVAPLSICCRSITFSQLPGAAEPS